MMCHLELSDVFKQSCVALAVSASVVADFLKSLCELWTDFIDSAHTSVTTTVLLSVE